MWHPHHNCESSCKDWHHIRCNRNNWQSHHRGNHHYRCNRATWCLDSHMWHPGDNSHWVHRHMPRLGVACWAWFRSGTRDIQFVQIQVGIDLTWCKECTTRSHCWVGKNLGYMPCTCFHQSWTKMILRGKECKRFVHSEVGTFLLGKESTHLPL